MIICQCQNITDKDIRAAVNWMRASDPDGLITAGKIYRSLGKRAKCGGCISLFITMMHQNDNFAIQMHDVSVESEKSHTNITRKEQP